MIVIAHYPDPRNFVDRCVDSCLQHMPLEQIAVVDTRDLGTYETGAWWEAYFQYPDETRFYFLHDSCVLNRPMPFYDPVTVVGSMNGWDGCGPGHIEWIRDKVRPIIGDVSEPFMAVHGSMFFCTRTVLEVMDEAGWSDILPHNKFESQCLERVWGIAFADMEIHPTALAVGEDCYLPTAIVQKFPGGRQ